MNNTIPLISIIILNYNGGKFIEECIKSIIDSNYSSYEIILVDNNSNDNSHKICKEKFSQIILIENKSNLGYCEGNNVGVRKARGEYLVILNPDTLVEKEWLVHLLDAYQKNGKGLYQPKLLAIDNKKRINTMGNMINLFGFGYSSKKGLEDTFSTTEIQQIGYASGACLFTLKKDFCKIGTFDPFLFAYQDDLDLGWRAMQQNIKSFLVPKSIVYHAESFSFKWSKMKFYLLERNRWYCLLTHYSKKTYYKILPSLILIEFFMFFYYLSNGMIKEKITGYSDLIKNRNLIHQKYLELEAAKVIPDVELIKYLQDTIETPKQVSGESQSAFFNSLLKTLARLSRAIL